jgi:hypothetical protein
VVLHMQYPARVTTVHRIKVPDLHNGKNLLQYAPTWNKTTSQPITIRNNNCQEEQQTTEPIDFISFASWTQLMILFDNIQPILNGYSADTTLT